MKVVSFDGGHIGIVRGNEIVDVSALAEVEPAVWPPIGMVQFIDRFDALLPALRHAMAEGEGRLLNTVRLDPPVRWPNKIVAFPANYTLHIAEMKENVISKANAKGQGFFLKSNSSISGPADPIVVPPLEGREIHHECELGIIIGRRGRGVARADAERMIFGFTCLIDMVIRGQEERVMRKSFDSFCPIGPWIVTPDEIPDMNAITMRLSVNGVERQSACVADLIVDIPEMIAMSSAVLTLEPGDIIATGTPAGVGPVVPGDTVTIEIEHVGRMELLAVAGNIGNHTVWTAAKEVTST